MEEVKDMTCPELTDMDKSFYKDYSIEDMQKKEQEIIKELEEAEKEIREHKYTLARSKECPRKQIGSWIATFLKRYECTWEYTKGMFDLITFWEGDSLDITYSYLDSTLRVLGGLKYSGDDYGKVVQINDYFQNVRELYKADAERFINLSIRHNTVMEAMEEYRRLHNIVDEKTE